MLRIRKVWSNGMAWFGKVVFLVAAIEIQIWICVHISSSKTESFGNSGLYRIFKFKFDAQVLFGESFAIAIACFVSEREIR